MSVDVYWIHHILDLLNEIYFCNFRRLLLLIAGNANNFVLYSNEEYGE